MTTPATPPNPLTPEIPPLKSQRPLFYALLALYVLWMLFLACLWYTTIHTAPKPATPPTQTFSFPIPAAEPAPTTLP